MSDPVSPAVRKKILETALAAESDLDSQLTVEMLAELAGMSDKHFQRTFRRVMGESPKQYVRRIRLQHAAYYLKWSDASITQLALHYGYATHAGFTKAFRKAYGRSPQDFRSDEGVTPYLTSPDPPTGKGARRAAAKDDAEEFRPSMLRPVPLTVRVEQHPSWRLATMRYIGPTDGMASIWKPMMRWVRRHGLLNDQAIFLGLHNDYWDENSADRYRYDAAVVVPEEFQADDDVNTMVLPGGPVAMTEFHGSVEQLDTAWHRFGEQWLPISGHQIRGHVAYDRYPPELLAAGPLKQLLATLTGVSATLCIPIATME